MRDAPVKVFLILGEAHTPDDRHTILRDRVCGIGDQVLSLPKVVLGLVVDFGLVVDKIIMASSFGLISDESCKGVSLEKKNTNKSTTDIQKTNHTNTNEKRCHT